MITKEEIKKFAQLARIKVDENDIVSLSRDIEGVLAYVSQIRDAGEVTKREEKPALRNVMREDGEPDEAGAVSETLLRAAPSVHEGYVAVKKIIER